MILMALIFLVRGTTPTMNIHSPPLKYDQTFKLFMDRSDLQDFEEIGEGNFEIKYNNIIVC